MWHKAVLPNKLRVITVPMEGTKAITALVLFGVGSRHEALSENGISHFIEHMMFKGTQRRPTTLELSRELDAVGAEFNAYTSRDHTGYYIKVDANHSELALDMLSDMLWHSKFDSTELEREKGVIVEEINMYQDNPTMHVEQLLEETIFPHHPLGRDIAGTAQTVTSFNRQKMLGYRDRFYQPQNGVLIVAGKIDEKTKKLINKYFGVAPLKKTPAPSFEKFAFGKTIKKLGLKYKDTDQTHLVLGWPAISYDDERSLPLSLLNLILGGTMSSRLFTEVRERRGLAYMVRSDANRYHETGNVVIQAGVDSKRAPEAVKVILSEVQKIKEQGVTAKELQMAKDNLAGHLVLSWENSSARADWFGKQALLMKTIQTPEEKLAKLNKLKTVDLQKVAKQIFDLKKTRLAVIGPYKKEKEILKWLSI
jgi:predicted Zn-dependent peptidase